MQSDEKIFQWKSARVRLREVRPGGWTTCYTGLISCECFSVLSHWVLVETHDARCIVVHFEKAFFASNIWAARRPGKDVFPKRIALVIVRPDQLQVWEKYAAVNTGKGIMRAFFLPFEVELVYQIANQIVGAGLYAAPQQQRSRHQRADQHRPAKRRTAGPKLAR